MAYHIYKYFPIYLFSLVWILVIAAVNLQLYNIQSVSSDTWIILIASLSAFISGYILISVYEVNTVRFNSSFQGFNSSFLVKLVLVFFVLSVIGNLNIMLAIGEMSEEGLMVYLQSPVAVRIQYVSVINGYADFVPLKYKLGSYLVSASFVANLFAGLLLTTEGKKRWIGLLPILAGLISSLAILGRYSFINSVGFIFLSYLLASFFYSSEERKTKLKQLFTFVVLISSVTYAIFYSIVSIRIVTDIDVQEYFNKSVYFYFSGGVVALDNFLDQSYLQLKYGLSSFRSLFDWLTKTGLWSEEEIIIGLDSFTGVSPSLSINTYTYIKSLYLDFGIIGVLLFSFGWGGTIKAILSKFYRQFTLNRLFWISVLIFGSLMTFYSFYFQSITQIVFWFIPVFIIQFFFGDKIVKSVPEA